MKISNELLAAYAAGNVTEEQRAEVRQYLTEHPEEMQSMVMMMDEDYELELDDADDNKDKYGKPFKGKPVEPFSIDLRYSAAAFAPSRSMSEYNAKYLHGTTNNVSRQLDKLLDDLNL